MNRISRSIGGVLILLGFCANLWAQDTSFKYGVVGKHEDGMLYIVDNNAALNSGSHLKVNFEFPSATWFYVFYLSSDDNYSLVYSFAPETSVDLETNYDSLGWLVLDENIGQERFIFVASEHQLDQLEELIFNYDNASGKSRERFQKRIAKQFENFANPSEGGDQDENDTIQLTRRLEKSVMGGVTFRSTSDEEISAHSLSYEATGSHRSMAKFQVQHQ